MEGESAVILSAHQPSFFPAGSFYAKAAACDLFVLLGNVQFTRGNYHNRFSLGNRYYTMGVSQTLTPLVDKQYNKPYEDWDTIKRKLPAYAPALSGFDDCIDYSLVGTNTAIIKRLFERLGIKTSVIADHPTELTATARLVSLCMDHAASTYLSGPSGRKYLDLALFEKAGIEVRFQEPVSSVPVLELLAAGQRCPECNSRRQTIGCVDSPHCWECYRCETIVHVCDLYKDAK